MAKIRTLVKIEQGILHLFCTCIGTGSVLEGCTGTGPRCTGTGPPKMPRMCVFLPFFHMWIPKSTQYSINTSKPLQFILKSLFLLKSSFITYLSSKIFHEFLPKTTLIWVTTHTQTKPKDLLGFRIWVTTHTQTKPKDLLGFILNPNSITCHLTMNPTSKRGFHTHLVPYGVFTKPNFKKSKVMMKFYQNPRLGDKLLTIQNLRNP